MRVEVDARLFSIAHDIAEAHTPVGWFPGIRRMVKVIKLRTDIYNALCYETDTKPVEYPEMLVSRQSPTDADIVEATANNRSKLYWDGK